MKRAIRKALALLLAVTVFSSTVDISAYAAEAEKITAMELENIGDEAVTATAEDSVERESTKEVSTEEVTEEFTEDKTEKFTEEISTKDKTEEFTEEMSTEDKTEKFTEEISTEDKTEEFIERSTEELTGDETTEGITEETTESIYEAENYKVVFTLTSQWQNGYNALVKIENTGDTVIHDWYLEYDVNYEFASLWNAEVYENADGICIIKNAGWNQDIAVGSYVEFGFSGNGEFIGFPTKYEILGESTQAQEEDYSIEYYLDSDWGSGFSGRITITNHTDSVLEDWTLEFDFNRSITSIWDGTIESQGDNHYVIRNAGYNENIEVGQMVSFGFNGEKGQKEDAPANYKLYTYEIADSEYIELADGKINRDYMVQAIYPNLLMEGLSIDNIKLIDDFDRDGLSLIEEYEYDTNPFSKDTDEDGLDDYEEVNNYGTNPIAWDTDADEMSDGTEVSSGLNPLQADSDGNGTLDGQEIVKQQVRLDSIKSYTLDEVDTLPTVEIVGQGDYSQELYAVAIENNKTILDIDALVGTPFEFVHDEDMTFSSSKLSFTISDELLAKNAIEDLAIAWYNYDENALELLETTCNKGNSTISANVEHYSTYMVVSVPDYFFNIDYENTGNIITSGKADVVFVVDTTGSMGGTIRNVKNNINLFVTKLEENKVDIRLGLVEYRDIYADGIGSTKSYDWYTNVDSFRNQLSSLGVSGGGDIPESAVDALYCAKNMSFRSGVKKYIILISDADYKDGIAGNESITMEDAIKELVEKDIVTSVVTRTRYFTDYKSLVAETKGVTANITNDFVTALEPLILKMGEQVNKGCWIRLSNGSVVSLEKDPTLEDSSVDTDGDGISDSEELKDSYQVKAYNPYTKEMQIIDTWNFYSDPSKKDTDGDGIDDAEDINPNQFDVVPIIVNESLLSFNTGRTWYMNDYTAKEIWDAHKRLEESEYDLNLNPGNAKQVLNQAAEVINSNDLQSFSTEELIFVALMDGDGIRFFLDSKTISVRESLFKSIYGRKTDYYQQQGLINRSWEKVSGYEANGFFKGKVLSEADIVYSFEQLRVHDIYSVIDLAKTLGIIVISSLIVVSVAYTVGVNIQALSSYVQTYGVKSGVDFYLTLGVSNAPSVQNSLMKALATELTDGDNDEYRLIDYVDDVIYTEDDVWALSAIKRGDYLDDVCGNNLVHNYPVIDRLDNRVIISFKSMDIRLKSYQNAKGIFNKIAKDASTLYKFAGKRWADINIAVGDYDSKVLRVILPNTTVTAEQMLGLQAAKLYVMNTYNIQIILTVATK